MLQISLFMLQYKLLSQGCFGISIAKCIKNNEFDYSIINDEDAYKYVALIPDRCFEGKMDCEKEIREYIKYYYVNVLSELDPEKVYKDLEWDRLVTFDEGEFSHGYIVAAWFELFLGIKVKCINDSNLYINDLKDVKPKWTIDILEDEIKKIVDN